MLRLIMTAASMVSLAACGSITRGTSEQVQFISTPPGATVTSNTKYACPATPCSIEVDRTDQFNATFEKPGYLPVTIPVLTKVAGSGAAGMAGNLIAGGVIGIGVDAATGAAMDHTPNPVIATLQPAGKKVARAAR